MIMFLKGGTVIEVSDVDYFCIISKEKVGFTLKDRDSKKFSNDCLVSFEEFIIPRQYVEKVEL